jgi:hypothetical protein
MSSRRATVKITAASFGLLLLASLHSARAQANATNQNPPAQKPVEAAALPKSTDTPSATPAPKTHKVITNDDIDATHARPRRGEPTGPVTGTGQCDEDCAQQVREWMGYQSWQDGEWHLQIEAARIKLAADSDWQRAYSDALRRTKDYCNFQYQLEAAILPSGDDFWARVDRAKRQQYAQNMGQVLRQGMDGARAQMSRLIEATRAVEPVRGAVMQVLAQRALTACDSSQ